MTVVAMEEEGRLAGSAVRLVASRAEQDGRDRADQLALRPAQDAGRAWKLLLLLLLLLLLGLLEDLPLSEEWRRGGRPRRREGGGGGLIPPAVGEGR